MTFVTDNAMRNMSPNVTLEVLCQRLRYCIIIVIMQSMQNSVLDMSSPLSKSDGDSQYLPKRLPPLRSQDHSVGYHLIGDRHTPSVPETATSSLNQLVSKICVVCATASIAIILCIYLLDDWGSSKSGVNEKSYYAFGKQREYMSLDRAYDRLWDEETTSNNGVVYLPPYSPDGTNENDAAGTISMFHQLHCLAMIRQALQRASEGQDIGTDDRHDAHWPHCLSYLRDSILCAASNMIELPRFDNGSVGAPFITGETDVREYRNSAALFALREEHGVSRLQARNGI